MNRRQALAAGAVGAVAAAAGAGWAWRRHRLDAVDEAAQAAFWALRFEQPSGGELAMASARGRPVLLNFWATWCPPCVKEMPLLDAFHRQHAAAGWQVIGLAVDGPTPVREFLARRPMAFPIGLAGMDGIELTKSLGNPGGQLPYSVVFDRSGRIHDRHLGAVDEVRLEVWVRSVG
jgi:thiol-disulfide isomerase/thioredoxin